MSRRPFSFYCIEGRNKYPRSGPRPGAWTQWTKLSGMYHIRKLETAQQLFEKSKESHQCEQTRLVKVTYNVLTVRKSEGGAE